jgi:hypothetical protein
MGMKEKMMNTMIDGMSSEEKKTMMEQMMDQFLGSLTDEEKQDMMNTMMPRMMEQMMGEGGNPMAGMMQMMMGGGSEGEKEGFNPMDMCREMMSGAASSGNASSAVTPEISALFSEWKQQLEGELLSAIQEKSLRTVDELASHLKLSRESVIYFLTALAQQDRIQLEVSAD